MRVLTIPMAVLFLCVQPLAADKGDDNADAGAAKAAACTACHNAMVDLKGRGKDLIASQTKAIRDGEKNHPPGLSALSDADIADIATYLNGL